MVFLGGSKHKSGRIMDFRIFLLAFSSGLMNFWLGNAIHKLFVFRGKNRCFIWFWGEFLLPLINDCNFMQVPMPVRLFTAIYLRSSAFCGSCQVPWKRLSVLCSKHLQLVALLSYWDNVVWYCQVSYFHLLMKILSNRISLTLFYSTRQLWHLERQDMVCADW